MPSRPSLIIGWICSGLVALFNIFAAIMKFVPVQPGTDAAQFMERLGTTGVEWQLGVLETIIVILYLVPRTSTVGFVLMVGYLAGALATNITHGFSFLEALPIYIMFVLITIGAYVRNPELLSRLKGRPVPAQA